VGDVIYVESPLRREFLGEKGENLLIKGVVPQYIGLNAFIGEKELQRFLRQGEISTSMLVKMDQSEIGAMKSKYRNASNVTTIEIPERFWGQDSKNDGFLWFYDLVACPSRWNYGLCPDL